MRAFSADDISVVLSYYAEDCPDKLESLKPSFLKKLPLEPAINPDDVVNDAGYLRKVTALVEERKRFGKDSPSVRIAPGRVSVTGSRKLLDKKTNLGLIFGAEIISFQDTVQRIQLDTMYLDVNVLGIHRDWLDCRTGKAARALVVDETGLVKDVTFEEAVGLHAVQVLHLPIKNEHEFHKGIDVIFESKGIEILNPYISSRRADDKNQTHELWLRYASSKDLDFPVYRMIPSSLDREGVVNEVLVFLEELKKQKGCGTHSIVVQPNKGTEGRKVRCFSVNSPINDIGALAEYVTECIHPDDDALLREKRGNVRFFRRACPEHPVVSTVEPGRRACPEHGRRDGKGYRNVVFRLNVAWDGKQFSANSGFVQVSMKETSFVASRSHGGEILDLQEGLMNIYHFVGRKWVRIIPSFLEISRMKGAASKALEALNSGLSEKDYLKFAGIDLLLEARSTGNDFELFPVLLEINPRPSGLSQSQPIPDML